MSAAKSLRIEGNKFERIVDNAIETENKAADVHISGNEIIDAFMPVSWQPLGGTPWPGPVYIHGNMITSTPAVTALWKSVDYPEAAFKIGAHDNNWKPFNKQMADVPRDSVSVPGNGFLVYNNTVSMPGARFLERTNGTASRKLLNFHFFNNVLLVEPEMNKGTAMTADTGIIFERNVAKSEVLAGHGGTVSKDGAITDPPAGTLRDNAPGSSMTVGVGPDWKSPVVGPQAE